METTSASLMTARRMLELLAQAAEGVMSNTVPVEKAIALAKTVDSSTRVLSLTVSIAGLKNRPRVLTELIGDPDLPLVIEDEDTAAEMASCHRSELAVVLTEIGKSGISAPRRAFLTEKRKSLEEKLNGQPSMNTNGQGAKTRM